MIYGLEDGRTAECEIYDSEAKLVLSVKAARNGDTVTVTSEGETKDFTVESKQGLNVVMA